MKYPLFSIALLVLISLAACSPSAQPADITVAPFTPPTIRMVCNEFGPTPVPEVGFGPAVATELTGCWPDSVWAWEYEINAASANNGIPANLIAAICVVQSNCINPDKPDEDGAVGLLSIVARNSTIALDNGWFTERPYMSELHDGAFNLNYGAQLLADNVHEAKNKHLEESELEYAVQKFGGTNYTDFLAKVQTAFNFYSR